MCKAWVTTLPYDQFSFLGSLYTLALSINRSENFTMPRAEKERFAKEVLDRWVTFQMAPQVAEP